MFDPVMIVSNSRNKNTIYKAYSPKIGRMVSLYNDLEYDNWIILESNPNIDTFCEKPIRIKSCYNGHLVETIFDMWIKNKNGSECLMKIKYDYEEELFNIKNQKKQSQVDIQKSWCDNNGFNYSIVTEASIRSNILYLNNMKQLIPIISQYTEIIETDIKGIIRLLDTNSRISINDIRYELNGIPYERLRNAVYWLIYTGSVNSDVKAVSLGYKTEIWKIR